MTKNELIYLLSLEKDENIKELFNAASAVRNSFTGNGIYLRGLSEISNRCRKNCLYCGIRRDNLKTPRFDTDTKEIIAEAKWCYENGYASFTIQSGERTDENFISRTEELLKEIKKIGNGALGITLSCGEQTEETYKRWFDAGAHRYLLRIESSNPEIYAQLHPNDGLHKWDIRYNCLKLLQKTGYQVGTGVMIGFPGQSVENLADDLLFFAREKIDMIGMGPYVLHPDTPLGKKVLDNKENTAAQKEKRLLMALKMIAVCRLLLKDVNIASTTALQALHPQGQLLGLRAGANILMPVVTDVNHRENYSLYENKKSANNCTPTPEDLQKLAENAACSIKFNQWGDSPAFFKRRKNEADNSPSKFRLFKEK